MKSVFEALTITIETRKNILVLDNCVWRHTSKMFKAMCLWSELAIVNLKLFNVTWLHTVVDFSTFPTIRVITLDALYDVNTPWRQFVEIRSQVDNAKSMGTQQGQDGLLEMVLCFVSEINSIFFFKWKKKIKFCSSNILCILFCWFVKLKKRMNARCQP